MKPDFQAVTIEDGQDTKKYYTKVGAAWNQKSDGVSVKIIPNIVVSDFSLFVEGDAEFKPLAERLNVFVVEHIGEDKNPMWHKIGTAFSHSKGYNVKLNNNVFAMKELVLRIPKAKSDN